MATTSAEKPEVPPFSPLLATVGPQSPQSVQGLSSPVITPTAISSSELLPDEVIAISPLRKSINTGRTLLPRPIRPTATMQSEQQQAMKSGVN